MTTKKKRKPETDRIMPAANIYIYIDEVEKDKLRIGLRES